MKIVYAPEAIRDLEAIKVSVIDKFMDTKLADDVVRDIIGNIRNLETFPNMGPKVIISKDVDIGYRQLFCRHNYVFYRVEQDMIYIARVLHEKQEFMRILFGITEE